MSGPEYNEIVGKRFGSETEGYLFYNNYAKEKGFSVRKSYCEWDNDKEERTLRRFVCSREGFREQKELNREVKKRKPRSITRVGCLARLVIACDENTGQWHVKEFISEHNHPMIEQDLACFLRSHRRISKEQKADIVSMQISGIRKHQIMDIMEKQYGGYDKVGFTARDLYNFCHRNKVDVVAAGDAQTVISYMAAKQNEDPDFFYAHRTNENARLKGLLWCDSQCRLDYSAFGDVVVFDSTYKTIRYNLPLVPFVGVNHHASTVLFACGIVCQETIESYAWLLKAFFEAMLQKHPVSVITDGDLAMQRAIGIVWPNSSHRLCTWHIEQNIVRNVKDDGVKKDFRSFLYDCSSIEENGRKWLQFLDKHKVTDKESWLYQMYERRETWCAAYHADKCYLGLTTNQRSESLNSRLQVHLDRKMTLLELVKHFDHCLWRLRRNENRLDYEAKFSPPLGPDAWIIEKEAAELFTRNVFDKVQFSIKSAEKCELVEVLDNYDTSAYIVRKDGKGDKLYHVFCEINVDEGKLKEISCSCRKLQCLGTPCSHIFYVLDYREEQKLPSCCVLKRWTKGAKSAFPPVRKSAMYDYSEGLDRYHELRNISHAASFTASRSPEAYERLKHVLNEEADMIHANGGENEDNTYGPVLRQDMDPVSTESRNVLDPMHVPGRGAPKKKMRSVSNKKRATVKCSRCKAEGHNVRTCSTRGEDPKLPEDELD